METTFTPGLSGLGGILIGLSATLLMASLGRIAGATGILAGLFAPTSTADWMPVSPACLNSPRPVNATGETFWRASTRQVVWPSTSGC